MVGSRASSVILPQTGNYMRDNTSQCINPPEASTWLLPTGKSDKNWPGEWGDVSGIWPALLKLQTMGTLSTDIWLGRGESCRERLHPSHPLFHLQNPAESLGVSSMESRKQGRVTNDLEYMCLSYSMILISWRNKLKSVKCKTIIGKSRGIHKGRNSQMHKGQKKVSTVSYGRIWRYSG